MEFKNSYVIGQKLQIQTFDNYIDKNKILVSQLLEVKSKGECFIAIPIHDGNLVPIPVGAEILVYYNIETKGVFYFRAKVLERTRDRVPHLKVRQIDETQIIQRRNYYRLEVKLPVEIYNQNISVKGFTKDISGGGLKIILDKSIEESENLFTKIIIEDTELIIKCKLLKKFNNQSREASNYETGVQFLEIDEKTRNCIVSYIFKQQRILRLKGLI